MSLVERHTPHYATIAEYATGKMLMLGDQIVNTQQQPKELFGVDSYQTLDTAGGDFRRDLTSDISDIGTFDTVFNLGTIEHIWDAAAAWRNAANLVTLGGYFCNVSPVLGYYKHGIHITDPDSIRTFFVNSGYEIVRAWFTDKLGNTTGEPKRNSNVGPLLFWFVAKRIEIVGAYTPDQTWEAGVWQPTN